MSPHDGAVPANPAGTLALGALLLLGACEVGAPGRVETPPHGAANGAVPFTMAGPNEAAIIVPVVINGEGPFDMVLDTGATLTCFSRDLADRLGLPEAQGGFGIGAGVAGAGRVELVEIDSLQVGEARLYDLTGCVLDLEPMQRIGIAIDGLLGLNVLRSFRVTLDFERDLMHLEDPGAPDGADAADGGATPDGGDAADAGDAPGER